MLRSLLVIMILIPGIVAGLFSRFAALQLYLWFALFRPQEWLWIDVSQLRLSLLIGLLLVIPSVLTGVLPDVTHPLSAGAAMFLLTALGAQLNAYRPDIGWEWLAYILPGAHVSDRPPELPAARPQFVGPSS